MKTKNKLTDKQILFSEWLASSPLERGMQKDMAERLEVSEQTLVTWKKLPEIKELVYKIYQENLIDLVGPATKLLEKAIKNPGSVSRVSYDCARYIVQDWSKKYQGDGGIARSIADLYNKYNPN